MRRVLSYLFVVITTVELGIQNVNADKEIKNVKNKKLPGLLYPRESESREVKSLDGLWDFGIASAENAEKFPTRYVRKLSESLEVMKMPVPSSYNDVTTSKAIRDHVGAVWYEREFFVPSSWKEKRVFIRFGSVHYHARVWINGGATIEHEMGHLPFEAQITAKLNFSGSNRVTVEVVNILDSDTVPQGNVYEAPSETGPIQSQSYTFDFFNYAGIHRPVLLHTKPKVHISDITVQTVKIHGKISVLEYHIKTTRLHPNEVPHCSVTLRDSDSAPVTAAPVVGLRGSITNHKTNLWWPRGMSDTPGYLYTLEVVLSTNGSTESDIYRLPIGIRMVHWNSTSLLLNGKPIYLRGFGRHEDSDIRGKGLDLVTVTRDHELLKWIGANSYRTSHYPYSDEVMDMADRQGFMIIDECPSGDTDDFSVTLLEKHKLSISELIRRDKNRPSVIMWSLSNEPRTQTWTAGSYFKAVAKHTRTRDLTRPITIALARSHLEDQAGEYLDIISFNRYNSWYSNPGRLDMIFNEVVDEASKWHEKYNKPVLMTEYGADTMPGLHELPDYVWSEEYQTGVLSKHFEAFDELREKGWFTGEFIWNFADFRTAQGYTRVGGNKKGIFTRNRQPKMAAHLVRERYHALAAETDGAKLPNDLHYYISKYNIHGKLGLQNGTPEDYGESRALLEDHYKDSEAIQTGSSWNFWDIIGFGYEKK